MSNNYDCVLFCAHSKINNGITWRAFINLSSTLFSINIVITDLDHLAFELVGHIIVPQNSSVARSLFHLSNSTLYLAMKKLKSSCSLHFCFLMTSVSKELPCCVLGRWLDYNMTSWWWFMGEMDDFCNKKPSFVPSHARMLGLKWYAFACLLKIKFEICHPWKNIFSESLMTHERYCFLHISFRIQEAESGEWCLTKQT